VAGADAVPSFVETGSYDSGIHQLYWAHLYTPLGLAHTPPAAAAEPVAHLSLALDHGCLTLMYCYYLPNVTGWQTKRNVMQYIFPMTAVELGPGYLIGRERVVSKASGTFGPVVAPLGPGGKLRVRVFDQAGWLTSSAVVAAPRAEVALGTDTATFAVVSWLTTDLPLEKE
jgi:hypothetical protein